MFFHVFGSRGLPREPQEAQEGSQEAPKTPKKKVSRISVSGKKCLSPAISVSNGSRFGTQNVDFFKYLFTQSLVTFWKKWNPFWSPFWDQSGPRGAKMSPKEPSGASKKQKTACSKTLKNHLSLKVFGYRDLSREPQEAQEGSQKAPKEIQDHKKGTQNWTQKLSNFGQILEPILGPKSKAK